MAEEGPPEWGPFRAEHPLRYPYVLLDAGGTLIGPRESFGSTYARILAPMGLRRSVGVFEEAVRDSWVEMSRAVPVGEDRYGHFPGGEEGFWLRFARGVLARAADGPVPDGLTERALPRLLAAFQGPEAWEVFEDVVPTLESLRDMGARLAVVSNWDSRLPAILEMLGLGEYFDAVTVSHLEGVEKPSPEIFRRVLRRLDARADLALHVGDVAELDLEGARAAGIAGILVDRCGTAADTHRDLSRIPELARAGLD